MQLKGFIGPSYELQATDVDAQRCINLYPQIDESGTGKNVAALLNTPGLKLWTTLPQGPIRQLYTTATGQLFAVAGNTLYRVNNDTGFINLGGIGDVVSNVGMSDNGKQLMIVNGDSGWSFDLQAQSLSPAAGFQGGSTVGFQDGFFIYNKPNSQQFYITGLYSTATDPLDFASKEGAPDNLVALLSDHRELWLFGQKTIEVWFNSGDPLFPFTRIDGAFLTHGTPAPASPCALDNTIYWLGQDVSGAGMAWKALGYQPVRCSTHAVEQAWRRYPRIDDAISYTYQIDGHAFWVLSFPSGNATWVFDAATQLWHERAYTGAQGMLERHRSNCHAVAYGFHFVGDYQNGNVYILDPQTYDDNTREIQKIRRSPYVSNELKRINFARLEVDMQVGLGTAGPDQTIVSVATLRWSDDQGKTWSNEYQVPLGLIGEYRKRVIWRRLGQSRNRIFEVKVADKVPVAMVDAFIEIEAQAS